MGGLDASTTALAGPSDFPINKIEHKEMYKLTLAAPGSVDSSRQ